MPPGVSASAQRELAAHRIAVAALVLSVAIGASLVLAQSTTVRVEGAALHVRAPAFGFIKDVPLARLKDGRSVRFDFSLLLMARQGAASLAQAGQSFVVSYDLWEERFAVTAVGQPARVISHLTLTDAEAWCVDHVALPLSANLLARVDDSFWLRLEYQVVDDDGSESQSDDRFTLRGLVDRLSRRRAARVVRDSMDAGPFRMPK